MRILEFNYGFDKRTDSICFLWSLDNNSQLHNLLLIRRSFWLQLPHINIIAWFVSVLFAYITNRIWVFESKDDNIIKEIFLFYGGRVFSGAIDTALMYVFISILMTGDLFAKIVVQVVVTILNYVFSKFLVFK